MDAFTIDLDSNFVPDAWALLFHAEGLPLFGDEDGDGEGNLLEAYMGTDPFDPASRLRILSLNRSDAGLALSWPTTSGKEYQIEVSSDLKQWREAGPWHLGDGKVQFRTIHAEQRRFTPGVVVRQWYDLNDGSGTGLARLRTHPAYQAGTPDQSMVLTGMQFDVFSPDRNRHGSRMRGYFIPPVTDNYEFLVTGDDQCELRLSPDADPAKAALIASVPDFAAREEWDKFPQQRSAPIELKGGELYYLDFEHVHLTGSDHAAVAFQTETLGFNLLRSEHLAAFAVGEPSILETGKIFARIRVRDRDSDFDGVSDYEEILLGFDPNNPSTLGNGVGDFDAIVASLETEDVISIAALDDAAYETVGSPARFELTREGNLDAASVALQVGGSATAGVDYEPLPDRVNFPVGVSSLILGVVPISDEILEDRETVTVTLNRSLAYRVGRSTATLAIEDAPATLFLARLRGVDGRPGIGLVRLQEWGNQSGASISFEVTNFGSPHTETALLAVPEGGGAPVQVVAFPAGAMQVEWIYGDRAGLSPKQIRRALRDGRLYVEFRTEERPEGELRGVLRTPFEDSVLFVVPPAPPELPGGPLSDAQAARFLSQATFGPTPSSLAELKSEGIEAWIERQMDPLRTRPSLHSPPLRDDSPDRRANRQDEWFRIVVSGEDQLRQRVAFALSEIFVVSQEGKAIKETEALAFYYDMLVEDAFGNYRDLLEKVTLSPVMGQYLSHVRNAKGDPVLGINPDENYAREIMQLFSIGLKRINPDGTAKLDANGREIPTYKQDTITNMARVFTGWSYYTNRISSTDFWWGSSDLYKPMVNFPDYHDRGQKKIIDGLILPANRSGEEDLRDTLDALHQHANTAPFICRRLIQRLVTSNPSPGYLYRVSQVFLDDGTGTRGNLGAVVRAILLDYEARSPDLLSYPGFGKQHEPLIRLVRTMRLLDAKSASGSYPIYWPERDFGQAAQRSPTVFNFFLPDYAPPGDIADAGLVAPEFQITSETALISAANEIIDLCDSDGLYPWLDSQNIKINWQPLISLYRDQGAGALVDYLDLYACSGQMPAEMRSALIRMLDELTFPSQSELNEYKVRSAVQVVINSAPSIIQK